MGSLAAPQVLTGWGQALAGAGESKGLGAAWLSGFSGTRLLPSGLGEAFIPYGLAPGKAALGGGWVCGNCPTARAGFGRGGGRPEPACCEPSDCGVSTTLMPLER